MLRFRRSALEHGVSKEQIRAVLANRWGMTQWHDIHDDDDGNSQDMALGFDAEGNPIEVGITYMQFDEVVFHANAMTPAMRTKYDEERKWQD